MRKQLSLVTVLAVFGLPAKAEPPVALQITTHDYAPVSIVIQDKVQGGIGYDLISQLLAELGVSHTITPYPFKRAMALAENTANGCVYPLSRPPDRETRFRWVGKLVESSYALLALQGTTFVVNSLADAQHYNVGTLAGGNVEAELRKAGITPVPAYQSQQNVLNLARRRIDLWAVHEMAGLYEARQEKVPVKVVLRFQSTDLYLACHPNIDPALFQRLQDGLLKLKKDGAMARAVARYLD